MEGRGMGISEKVSESLLAQLDRLEAVDASNADALRMEISRAKAVQGITLVNMDHVAYVEVIESCE